MHISLRLVTLKTRLLLAEQQSISHMQLWQLMSLDVSQETRGRAKVDAQVFKTRVTMQLGYVAL